MILSSKLIVFTTAKKTRLKSNAIALILLTMAVKSFGHQSKIIQIDHNESWYCLQDYALFFHNTYNYEQTNEVLTKINDFNPWDQTTFSTEEGELWMLFETVNHSFKADSIFLNGQLFDYIDLYEIDGEDLKLISSSGYLVPLKERPIKEWGTLVSAGLGINESKKFLVRFKSVTHNSKQLMGYVTAPCIKLFTQKGLQNTYSFPKYLVFFFYGAILMMAIYNLGISISTHFKECLLFSIYNFLTVVTVFAMSGQHLEFQWLEPFDFERNLRYIPSLLVAYSYIRFSVKLLEIKRFNRFIHLILIRGNIIYLLMIIALLMSLYELVFIIFTLTTSILFLIILISAMVISKRNKYARFFLAGNIIVCSAAFLQLASLYNLITTTEMVIGSFTLLMLEIIVFSFAVAYKLKVSKRAMLNMEFSNLIQKEKLRIEEEIRRRLELAIDEKSRALTSSSVQWLNMSDKLDKLKESIQSDFNTEHPKKTKNIIRQLNEIKSFEDQWSSFKIHFESVHPDFFQYLEKAHPNLTQNDLKLCAFMKMKLSNKEMAIILNVTKKAIEQSKRRMRKKLALDHEENILKFFEKSMKEERQKSFPSTVQFALEQ